MAVLKHYSYNGNEISITPTVVILEEKDGGALAYWDRTEFSSLEEYVVKSNSAPRKIREKLAVCYCHWFYVTYKCDEKIERMLHYPLPEGMYKKLKKLK